MVREQTDGGPVSHMLISSGSKSSPWKSQRERERWEWISISFLLPSQSLAAMLRTQLIDKLWHEGTRVNKNTESIYIQHTLGSAESISTVWLFISVKCSFKWKRCTVSRCIETDWHAWKPGEWVSGAEREQFPPLIAFCHSAPTPLQVLHSPLTGIKEHPNKIVPQFSTHFFFVLFWKRQWILWVIVLEFIHNLFSTFCVHLAGWIYLIKTVLIKYAYNLKCVFIFHSVMAKLNSAAIIPGHKINHTSL